SPLPYVRRRGVPIQGSPHSRDSLPGQAHIVRPPTRTVNRGRVTCWGQVGRNAFARPGGPARRAPPARTPVGDLGPARRPAAPPPRASACERPRSRSPCPGARGVAAATPPPHPRPPPGGRPREPL